MAWNVPMINVYAASLKALDVLLFIKRILGWG